MSSLFRRSAFWIVFALLSLLGVAYAVKFFPEAFPLLSVDLKMDRETALKRADEIAERQHLGPEKWLPTRTGGTVEWGQLTKKGERPVRKTAVFDSDDDVQNYVELEAGGKAAFRALISGGRYAPYQWIVRRFREGDKHESRISFTPQGEPYGFTETLSENDPGAALPADAALALARQAAADWKIDLSQYNNPPDESEQAQPSKRLDHTFTWERPDKIGEARLQLVVTVSGDRVTQLERSVDIPEGFQRRYAAMRSVNDTIYSADQYVIMALYAVGCCMIGLFFLLRERWVLWRGAVAAGLLVSFLQFLASLNGLPLQWMQYDTALASRTFILTQLVVPWIREFLNNTFIFSLSFIAAESLTRKAFPRHIQAWKLWTRDVAASPQVLGRTVAGYLVVGIDLAFVVAFYIVTERHFGWWSPAEMLTDPNLPANYFPWFTPIAQAFQAGSWEESLFRAVPLAGAALLGRRFGFEKTAIAVAFVAQALIFGAGHATYPVQPAYGRLVELIVPASIFGFLYLRFGFLPAILAHFFYDVVMMSLSLLASSLPGIWIDRTLLALFALLPLWIALGARWRGGRRAAADVPESARNAAWTPPAPWRGGVAALESAVRPSRRAVAGWIAAGAVGLALWLAFVGFTNLAPRLVVSRAKAEAVARETLAARGVTLDASWTVLSGVGAARGDDDSFVWRHGMPADYAKVMGRFLDTPFWQVRFVRFTGDVAARAEEYQVRVTRHGEVAGFDHRLPEARPGAALSLSDARTAAAAALRERFGVDAAALAPVASKPVKQPARTDWGFVWADPDPGRYPLKAGQGRYAVALRGDEVGTVRGLVFIPDEWTRQETERQAPLNAFAELCNDFLFYGMCGALAAAIVAWSLHRFSVHMFLLFLGGAFGIRLVQIANGWPALENGFSTAKAVAPQAFQGIGSGLLHAFFGALSIGAAAGYFHGLRRQAPPAGMARLGLIVAAGIALAWAGTRAATGALVSIDPPWASYTELGAALPWMSAALGRLVDIAYTTAEFLWLFRLADIAARAPRPGVRSFAPALVIVAGTLVYLGAGGIDSFGSWFAAALAAGSVLAFGYLTFLRLHRAWLPLAFGIIGAAGSVKQGIFLAWPGAWGYFVGAALLVGAGWFWTRRLATGNEEI